MELEKNKFIGGKVSEELYQSFSDYAWKKRMSQSELLRVAIEEKIKG